jgi:hypothetical protein
LRPDAIEEWKKIAEERSIRLKVAIRKWELESKFSGMGISWEQDTWREKTYGGNTLLQNEGNYSSLWEGTVRLTQLLNFWAVDHNLLAQIIFRCIMF